MVHPYSLLPYFLLVTTIVAAYDGKFISIPAASREEVARALTSTNTTTTKISHPFPAILGGTPVDDDEFPWFGRTDITFFTDTFSFGSSCGASLIHSDIAVSAAHCIADDIRENVGYSFSITFYLGANTYDGRDGIALEVESLYYPKDYDFPFNDVVLYKLRTPTQDVTPVVWNTNPLTPFTGDIGTAIGFGVTTPDGDASSILLKVDLPAISNVECSTYYRDPTPVSISCVYAEGEGRDICQGDSGGPIITNTGVLYGVTSYSGEVCGESPSGFTRTSYVNDFITKVRTDCRIFTVAETLSSNIDVFLFSQIVGYM